MATSEYFFLRVGSRMEKFEASISGRRRKERRNSDGCAWQRMLPTKKDNMTNIAKSNRLAGKVQEHRCHRKDPHIVLCVSRLIMFSEKRKCIYNSSKSRSSFLYQRTETLRTHWKEHHPLSVFPIVILHSMSGSLKPAMYNRHERLRMGKCL